MAPAKALPKKSPRARPADLARELAALSAHKGKAKIAREQAAYMRDQFHYFGLKTPERRVLLKAFLKPRALTPAELRDFAAACWKYPQREMQYVALEAWALAIAKDPQPTDLPALGKLLVSKSWWDTVDTIAPLVGEILAAHPAEKTILNAWLGSKNLWLQRCTLIFQLRYKRRTDVAWLEHAITKLQGDREFFIQKAIGWSLREHSKHDAAWVRDFLRRHPQGPLATREASKYL